MRPKRAKAYKKVMQFYQQNFGFREPYQILVSPDFVLEGVAKKLDLVTALEEVVGGKVRPMITFCGISEVRKEGPHRDAAIAMSKKFEKRRCPHKTPISGADCVREIIGESNKHNYCVAAQGDELRTKLRKIPGIPIIHGTHSVVVLEPIPKQSKAESRDQLQEKLGLPELERQMLKSVKTKAREAKAAAMPMKHKKKKKGPKGPNPLSVQKSKKSKATGPAKKKAGAGTAATGTKRPRSEAQDGATAPQTKKHNSAQTSAT
ncbi:hypothetical protein IWW50_002107 [Coemansia erecta]|nr:hypothetical protein GGF43_000886 [Coemansia sp. RSA 2618]KAJ2826983.1 hypothetical protein IWW50_002107 [Coemansia erecta]